MTEPHVSLPLGIVVQRRPGVTRWAKWNWKATSVMPGAPRADWSVLRAAGDITEYHAATVPLELYRSDTEAYLTGLAAKIPTIGIVMRETDGDHPLEITLATASPYETQDYLDSGEEIVELVPMPEGLVALIRDFCADHHEDEVFVKRKRDKHRIDLMEDGKGDVRIRQLSDVYRAPGRRLVQ